MPPIRKVQDQLQLVETTKYNHAKWKFNNFNPVQSRVFEFYDNDVNALVAAATSAGKTVCAELFLAHEVRVRGGKGMFLGPLKALTQEKIDDWTDPSYHFADKNVSICTGDYRLTPDRKQEFMDADLFIMTSEMLNHRSRNFKSEQNDFLKEIGTLVIDESHLLTVPERGHHLEVGLMKFTDINPDARIVLLSATMPNVDEIGEWVSYVLNKKNTYVLTSKYRPCPLNVHYEMYFDGSGSYDSKEQEKINYALDIVEHYTDDKFLIFVHTKRTGDSLTKALRAAGICCEYHNADLDKTDRVNLERRFREDKTLKVVVATSTLAWGLNMPARRVIVLGIHRGLQEVETYNIKQMVGRAGRPSFDPMGDAYVLLPESKFVEQKERLKKSEPITSQLLQDVGGHYKVLAFHIVSEIHHGDIKTKDDVYRWYKRSLAHYQAKNLDDAVVDKTLDLLKKYGAIREEGTDLIATSVGTISSMFYYSPFDVSDLRRNFKTLFEYKKSQDDIFVAMALGNVDSQRYGICNKLEREEMGTFAAKVRGAFGSQTFTDSCIKAGFAYHCLLNGHGCNAMAGYMRNIQWDFNRMSQVLLTLDTMSGKWNKHKFFIDLQSRMTYGVSGNLVDLVKLPDVGRVRAKKLYEAGLHSLEDVANADIEVVRQVLGGMKKEKVEEIVEKAKLSLLGAP